MVFPKLEIIPYKCNLNKVPFLNNIFLDPFFFYKIKKENKMNAIFFNISHIYVVSIFNYRSFLSVSRHTDFPVPLKKKHPKKSVIYFFSFSFSYLNLRKITGQRQSLGPLITRTSYLKKKNGSITIVLR